MLLRDLREMASLINDLLESERLSTRHAALQREPVSLVELSNEVIAEVLARLPVHSDARHEVVLKADPELPVLELDPMRIRLLLRNLLDNALRHGAGAQLPPELHLRMDDKCLQIEVRDHGPGVPDDQLPHLAEPFFRPDAARTRAQGGVGLGLTLCKLVVQAHGGTFLVRNARPGLSVILTFSRI
jgi:signal transduction histidine kinase